MSDIEAKALVENMLSTMEVAAEEDQKEYENGGWAALGLALGAVGTVQAPLRCWPILHGEAPFQCRWLVVPRGDLPFVVLGPGAWL